MRRILAISLFVFCASFAACGPDPQDPSINDPPAKLGDGAPCQSNAQCEGGLCYASFFGFPRGYCTTPNCADDSECSGGGSCLRFIDESSACFASCTQECRDGYACVDFSGSSICSPTDLDLDSISLTPDAPFNATLQTLGANCEPVVSGDGAYLFDFELSADADSFMFVPFVPSGEVAFEALRSPARAIDRAEYRHHNTRFEDIGVPGRTAFGTFGTITFDWPVLVPFAPQYQDLVTPGGSYTVRVTATEATPCLYVVEGNAEGTQIDLDVYLVTNNGPTAVEAAESPDFEAALAAAEGHLAPARVSFGEVRFHDAAPSVSERFSIVRDLREVDLLAATGKPAGPTLSDHLSVDVFIVDSIVFDGITALGISAGVPGPVGMHGNLSNGLVFSAPDLGVDNELVGQILAHELSHYLGLRHTTELIHGTGTESEEELEQRLGTTDPIDDTPVCPSVQRMGSGCPDYDNLMFPTIQSLAEGTPLVLSPGQQDILRRSPLVKVAAE